MQKESPLNLSSIPGALSPNNPPPIALDYILTVRPRWAQRITAPLNWPYYLLLTAAALWLSWIGRYPYSLLARIACILLLSLFALIWLVWFLLRRMVLQKYPVPPLPNTRRFRPLQVVIAIGITLAVMLHFEIPSRIAFRFSEPAMRQKAESILTAKDPPVSPPPPSFFAPQHVGLFDFDSIIYLPSSHAIYFYLRDGGLFTDTGWTYSPNNPPDPPQGEAGPGTQTPYDGPWYRTTLQW